MSPQTSAGPTPAPLWTAAEVLAACAGRWAGQAPAADRPITGVSIDSRTLAPGDLFFAIQGPTHDGHEFVAKALAAGAAAAIVHRLPAGLSDRAAVIVVADTMAALEALGRAARARATARFVAITGSVGKTGTKEALRNCLARLAPTHAAEKSFNNHWGVPLTLARMPRDTERAIFEIGMNTPGEIAPRSKMVRP
ncbi:MAG: Mur ligase family protein, partial [Rhodanobacter sp.]